MSEKLLVRVRPSSVIVSSVSSEGIVPRYYFEFTKDSFNNLKTYTNGIETIGINRDDFYKDMKKSKFIFDEGLDFFSSFLSTPSLMAQLVEASTKYTWDDIFKISMLNTLYQWPEKFLKTGLNVVITDLLINNESIEDVLEEARKEGVEINTDEYDVDNLVAVNGVNLGYNDVRHKIFSDLRALVDFASWVKDNEDAYTWDRSLSDFIDVATRTYEFNMGDLTDVLDGVNKYDVMNVTEFAYDLIEDIVPNDYALDKIKKYVQYRTLLSKVSDKDKYPRNPDSMSLEHYIKKLKEQ